MATPIVYVLTFCQNETQLYGTTLVFETLRVGFPNATVHVVDNASLPEVRATIRERALACKATHHQFDRRWRHESFILQALKETKSRSVVFVDPDVCFWEKVEDWSFSSLLAGRLIPRHFDMTFGCIAQPRLHPSFLWFPNVTALFYELGRLKTRFFDAEFFQSQSIAVEGKWQRYDTCAALYHALIDHAYAFTPQELDAYDHLFCGTHLDQILMLMSQPVRELVRKVHDQAKADYRGLRGMWRWQEEHFKLLRDEPPDVTQSDIVAETAAKLPEPESTKHGSAATASSHPSRT